MKATGSIQLRKNTYHMMVRYQDADGIVRQKSKSTKIKSGSNARDRKRNLRQAEVMLSKWIDEIEANGITSSRSFMTALEEWMERKRDDIRPNSYQSYESYVKNHIKPYWGKKNPNLNDITVRDIQKYIDYEHKAGFSTQSIKRYLVVINGVFDDAIRYGEIKANPCSKAKLPKSKEFRGQAYTPEQAQVLLQGVENDPVKPAIMLALYLGLRRSEIAGLRWIDIDFDNDIVRIRNTVVRFSNWIEDEHTKSRASRRDLYLPKGLKLYLLELRQKQEHYRKLFGDTYDDCGHVCQHPDGTAFTTDYIYGRYKRIQKRLNLPSIRLHDLRHTAGSLLINSGQTVKQVQAFLGHEKASTTLDVYSHLNMDDKRNTADVMDALLSEQSC